MIPGIQRENPMDRRRRMLKAAACLPAFFILAGLTAFAPPGRAQDGLTATILPAGTYDGTFTFNLDHTYNEPQQMMPMN